MHDPCWLSLLHFVKDNGACCGSPLPDLPSLPSLSPSAALGGGASAAAVLEGSSAATATAAPPFHLSAVSSWMLPSSDIGGDEDGSGSHTGDDGGDEPSFAALLAADMTRILSLNPRAAATAVAESEGCRQSQLSAGATDGYTAAAATKEDTGSLDLMPFSEMSTVEGGAVRRHDE